MMLIAYLLFGLCALRQSGIEASIEVYFETIKIVDISTEYFDPSGTVGKVVTVDDGDTAIAWNLTIVKTLPPETVGHLKLLALSMGMYNVPTGIDITMQLCDMLNEPILMGPVFEALGFKTDACPPGPGFYSLERYQLPVESLPDEFDENSYLAVFEILLGAKILMSLHVNAAVQNG